MGGHGVTSLRQRAGTVAGTVGACPATHPGRGRVWTTLGQEHRPAEAGGHQRPRRGAGTGAHCGPRASSGPGIQIQVGLDLRRYSRAETRKLEWTQTGLACWRRGRGGGLWGLPTQNWNSRDACTHSCLAPPKSSDSDSGAPGTSPNAHQQS